MIESDSELKETIRKRQTKMMLDLGSKGKLIKSGLDGKLLVSVYFMEGVYFKVSKHINSEDGRLLDIARFRWMPE